jgi:hypothetical protein
MRFVERFPMGKITLMVAACGAINSIVDKRGVSIRKKLEELEAIEDQALSAMETLRDRQRKFDAAHQES